VIFDDKVANVRQNRRNPPPKLIDDSKALSRLPAAATPLALWTAASDTVADLSFVHTAIIDRLTEL
jgi:hypothetical protein